MRAVARPRVARRGSGRGRGMEEKLSVIGDQLFGEGVGGRKGGAD